MRKRKIRVTKNEIIDILEANKISSSKHKKTVKPGPWTNIEPQCKVKANIKQQKDTVITDLLGPALGNYLSTDNWGEKGWYPILFNLEADQSIIKKHGLDQFIAASEKSLNNQLVEDKPRYGTLIITRVVDHSDRGFISCYAKTNKKSIKGFRAIRENQLVVL